MLIVVSGTHATGKSTLIGDFSTAHPEALVYPDPFEDIDAADESPDAEVFYRQLAISASRLVAAPADSLVIAERGPLDFLAYLDALHSLGRSGRPGTLFRQGVSVAARAMRAVDVLVLLPVDARLTGEVDPDEDPELRLAMNDALFELADDPDLIGSVDVVEVAGGRADRLAQLEALAGPT